MSVILINAFEIDPDRKEKAIEFWELAADHMRKQSGFISTRLHAAVVPWARFPLINVAEWESVEQFEAVTNSEEFKNLAGPYTDEFPHYPGLYEVIRT